MAGGQLGLNGAQSDRCGTTQKDPRDRIELPVHEVVGHGVAHVNMDRRDEPLDVDELFVGIGAGQPPVGDDIGHDLQSVPILRDCNSRCRAGCQQHEEQSRSAVSHAARLPARPGLGNAVPPPLC